MQARRIAANFPVADVALARNFYQVPDLAIEVDDLDATPAPRILRYHGRLAWGRG